jgi:ATP-independent RNA helicase DbpA
MSFSTLSLRPELLQSIEQIGYTVMTPIQAAALPPMLAGRDVAGQAKTGSGKTAAFGLALLNAIDPQHRVTQALVLCPTRELAEQVAGELRRLARCLAHTQIVSVCGGHPYHSQRKALQGGGQVVVGTPGRVAKHIRAGSADLSGLKVLVLDEADRMLDMGFFEEVIGIETVCPKDRQTLLFSATFTPEIHDLGETLQRDPQRIQTAPDLTPELLEQRVVFGPSEDRSRLVMALIAAHRPSTALVFSETRVECDRLARFLTRSGAHALALHGQLEQRDRDDVLVQFSNGSITVLVATDLAARGLDIPELPLVIVSELSGDPEVHVHRIGRTGRAGAAGLALSIVAPREKARLSRIEAFLGASIPVEEAPELVEGLDLPAPVYRTLMLFSGRKDKLRKADVLGALVKDGGIPADAVGRIDLAERTCAVALKRGVAERALRYLEQGRIKRKRVRARLL